MATGVITVNRDTKPGLCPILLGHVASRLQQHDQDARSRKALATIQFPEQKRHDLGAATAASTSSPQREDGTPKCVACYMCATVCPAECIYIEAGERPEKTIEKYPTRFEIDLLRCVYCGFCVDACPEEAIVMSRENDLVGTTRAELIIDRDRLMDRGKLDRVRRGLSARPTTTCAVPCASPPSSGSRPSTGSCRACPTGADSPGLRYLSVASPVARLPGAPRPPGWPGWSWPWPRLPVPG